jgi:lactaldehyde dehydrogenase/glycolaldehyde dehydrogenase
LPACERAAYLHKLADALEVRREIIGAALAQESGKSLSDSSNEAFYAAEVTRYHAEWARRVEGEIIPSDSPSENLLLVREAIGVAACLIPFNYPVYTLLRKIAPALITGNTVVVRPSNNTPCSAFEIAQAVVDAAFPAGVINILAMSHDVAETLCTHSKVGIITLTGSVGAGRTVLEYSKVNIAKSSLELGGKTPAIIEADADLAQAAKSVVGSTVTHCGQLCTSVERIYVQESIYDEFLALLKAKFTGLQYGNRAENPSFMGPLVSAKARTNIHNMVMHAVEAGAKLEIGGFIPEGKGYFYPATLLTECRQDMEIVQEEIFGPVLCVLKYITSEEALALANDHQFGLASVLFTENYRTIMQFAVIPPKTEVFKSRTQHKPCTSVRGA